LAFGIFSLKKWAIELFSEVLSKSFQLWPIEQMTNPFALISSIIPLGQVSPPPQDTKQPDSGCPILNKLFFEVPEIFFTL
jgi:hypothetical protein